MIKGDKVYLRAVEPEDIERLYLWENDPAVWNVSISATLYSKFVLREYVESSHKSIYETAQQRFMICRISDDVAIGTIDLFDFDAHNKRAGVGILIYDKSDRGSGFATESILLLENYVINSLDMHQLYCNIVCDNAASVKLFERNGFTLCGTKKEWLRIGGEWFDELIYQKIF